MSNNKESLKSNGNNDKSKFSDNSQLEGFLEAVKNRYAKKTIDAALKTLPLPPEIPEDLNEEQELIKLFKGFTEAFGPELVWEKLKELGFNPPKDKNAIFDGGGVFVNLDHVVGLEVMGRYESSISSGDNKDKMKDGFSNQDWELKMLEDGIIRLFFKGNQKLSDDWYDVQVQLGDTVRTSHSVLSIKHTTERNYIAKQQYDEIMTPSALPPLNQSSSSSPY